MGAGFALAMRDLELRGAGNLLGEEQSGHIREVGVELYQQMLEDAVKALRSGETLDTHEVADDWSPQIDVGAAVLIPEGYVEDLATRLSLYRRLADLQTDQEREAFAAELIEFFENLRRRSAFAVDGNRFAAFKLNRQCRRLRICFFR